MRGPLKGLRLHIGIFGRRNVGKSSLLNAITRQHVSIVSAVAGTTTDPVEKPMEFLPLGPVLFVDTAGIDDLGMLGEMRVQKTRKVLDRVDLGVVVSDGAWGEFEEGIEAELRTRDVPVIAVMNKSDLHDVSDATISRLESLGIPWVSTQADRGDGILRLRELLLENAPADFLDERVLLADLVGPGETAVLVMPIDKEAPRGRLILPQAQAVRDLLDHHSISVVVQEPQLLAAINQMTVRPKLVVTDSQAFQNVMAITPPDIPVTGFSVLFSRFRGDLITQVEGTLAVDRLEPGDRVLVAEACSHHPIGEDIGRVKIPRWLTNYVGGELKFTTVQGHDFPEELSPFKLVIHCGACMTNRREVLNRILKCRDAGVPITNYGLVIAYSLGVLERVLGPFPEALETYRRAAACKVVRS